MIELEVKFGPKTGLETVQNGEHAVVEVAPYDDLKQSPLVRVTHHFCMSGHPSQINISIYYLYVHNLMEQSVLYIYG